MNRSKMIREWLATQDGPRTSKEMAVAVGGDCVKVQWAVGVMLRDGILRRVRAARPCTYEIARDAMTKWESLAAMAEARRLGIIAARPLKQAQADERRRERIRASDNARRVRMEAKREADRVKREAERKAIRRYVKVLEAKPAPAPAPKIRTQSVDDWMAKGGRIERLPTHWQQNA